MSDELQQELEYYKKQFEISQRERDTIKEETQTLRKELKEMKEIVKKIVIPKKGVDIKSPENNFSDKDMVNLLEFQRKRLDELEKNSQDVNKNYEKLLFEKQKEGEVGKPASVALAEKNNSAEVALEKANEKLAILEAKFREMTSGFTREVAGLKNKLGEDYLSEEPQQQDKQQVLVRSGSLSAYVKREPKLEPIRGEKNNIFSATPLIRGNTPNSLMRGSTPKLESLVNLNVKEDQSQMFTTRKRILSRQGLG